MQSQFPALSVGTIVLYKIFKTEIFNNLIKIRQIIIHANNRSVCVHCNSVSSTVSTRKWNNTKKKWQTNYYFQKQNTHTFCIHIHIHMTSDLKDRVKDYKWWRNKNNLAKKVIRCFVDQLICIWDTQPVRNGRGMLKTKKHVKIFKWREVFLHRKGFIAAG